MTPAEYKERREILLKQLSDLDAEFNGTSSSTSKNKNIVDTNSMYFNSFKSICSMGYKKV